MVVGRGKRRRRRRRRRRNREEGDKGKSSIKFKLAPRDGATFTKYHH